MIFYILCTFERITHFLINKKVNSARIKFDELKLKIRKFNFDVSSKINDREEIRTIIPMITKTLIFEISVRRLHN